jgi:hypothetical protein
MQLWAVDINGRDMLGLNAAAKGLANQLEVAHRSLRTALTHYRVNNLTKALVRGQPNRSDANRRPLFLFEGLEPIRTFDLLFGSHTDGANDAIGMSKVSISREFLQR